jgi:hypothetical protein
MKLGKNYFAALLVLSFSFSAFSQDPLRDFLQGGVGDASILTKAYLRPYGEMLGTSLNAGWYNTAKVHRLGGFDITVSVMNSVAPSSAQTFDINALPLDNFVAQGAGTGDVVLAPTVAGEMDESMLPTLAPKVPGGDYVSFKMPNGSGNDKLPVPMLQAAVGLPFHSEIIARVVPKISFGDAGDVSVLGFGLKHSLKDYIPFVKRVPFLEMSVLAGYTSLNSSINIESGSSVVVENGELAISSGAFTTRLLLGANFPVVALYTGMGYGTTSSDFDVNGTYSVSSLGETFTDPFSLNYKTNGFDFNAGLRLRLGFLALHADYTVGNYSVLTAGVGINIR